MKTLIGLLFAAALAFGQYTPPASSANLPAFSAEQKGVVFIGSSVTAGTGASAYANSWAGLLTAAQSTYTFTNLAVSGQTSAQVIAGFYPAVPLLHPSIVIIGSTLNNETGGGTPTAAAVRTYLANMARLVKMVEAIDAVPVLAGPSPNGFWTAAGCGLVRDAYDQFDTWGVQVWDLLDPAANPASTSGCAYQAALDLGDGLHPNNAGHAALFSAVNYDYLDLARSAHQNIAPSAGQQAMKYGSDTSNAPFQLIAADGIVSAPSNLSSWSVAFWIKDAGNSASVPVYWHAEGSTGPVRIRSSGQNYQLTDGTTNISSTTATNNQAWHQVGVTYNYPANSMCLYTDGVQIGCSAGFTQFQATGFDFLGRTDSTGNNCVSCYLGPVQLFRAPLDTTVMKDLYSGRVRSRSLAYSSGMGTTRTWEFNEANTGWVGEPFTGTNGLTNAGPFGGATAVANTRRECDAVIGDTSGSALTNAQLGPQKRLCYIPAAATIVELDVSADAGTPSVIVASNTAGSVANIVSGALSTAASGGIACSNIGTNIGIDRATTCSGTLQNTALAAGSYLELVSGTAGGTAKLMTIHVIYTIN